MRLSEYIVEENFTYLIRPYYNLGNLCDTLANCRVNQLTEEELRYGARAVCKALNTIHKAGYLHGDVRPQNVFLNRSSRLTISLGEYECCYQLGS